MKSVSEILEKYGKNLKRGQFVRFDEKKLSIGDSLPPSRKWRDGEPTNFTYTGTCVLSPKTKRNYNTDWTYYYGNIYVVSGKVIRKGADYGERIIKNAVVVDILEG